MWIDPNTEAMYNLHRLGEYIEMVKISINFNMV